ncbi:MAG: hypothetical protein A2X61_02740 [Ignavibacteria bacterium GWB2_35_12]|nr:MAG: hypothetical protein A2X61_02740 [Ignavibacteria bacterium GWB2_35_12]OGU89895.1 MAG: hypothetical protein A2220_05900 [Ignavibacteria bacterium RIFOXYA2_FULL_35_10]OGV24271.1 MAG: hypothetical protein A2475_08665 [Ignavibacteria bacterium RIFOXYC2_FULL_35_21]
MRTYIFSAIIIALMNVNVSLAVDEYYLTCDPAKLQEIIDKYNEDIYIDATLTFNGKTWQDVQIRIRGQDTRAYPKKPLKVKFNGEAFLDDIDEFNFNAEYGDKSYMRQYLSSRIMIESGLDCFRTSHARLYINGEYYGLYLKIEQVGKRFLRDRGLNDDGNLYKASLQNLSCLSKWDNLELGWEKKTNEGQGNEDLAELIRKLDVEPDATFYNLMHDIFDYNQMINFLALNIVIANTSTYYHNYFMYNDMYGTQKWLILPWDMDKSMGAWWPNNLYNSNSSRPDNPIYEKSFLLEQIFSDVRKRIDTICSTVFTENHLFPIIDSLIAELTPSVIEDTHDNISDTSQWMAGIGMNKYFIQARYSKLNEQYPIIPRVFRVESTNGTYTGDIKLVWHPCTFPENTDIKYKLCYSKEFDLYDTSKAKVINNLTDTVYTINKSELKEGLYYWKVSALANGYETDGYDNFNKFTFKNGTILQCPITQNTILTKEGSPYTIDCDMEVVNTATLTINNGVELYILNNSQVNINGSLRIEGTKEEPVLIKSISNDTTGNLITLSIGSGNSSIKFADFENVFIYFNTSSDILIEDSKFNYTKEINRISLFGAGCIFTMRRCSLIGQGKRYPEGMIILSSPKAIVEDSYFNSIFDAVEYIKVASGIIQNNLIKNSTDDGIDLNGGDEIVISYNKIFNSIDKGISIGNDSYGGAKQITVERNIIVGCNTAIGIKDSAEANIINNTFYNNNSGIMCFEKNINGGGGFAVIKNCIISNSKTKSYGVDEKSIATVTYTLSNTDYLKDGVGNMFAEPQFEDPANNNFNLKRNSPCINKGDPASPKDPDGSRADIGAIPFNSSQVQIVINEINYNSSADFETEDWVEFYNPEKTDADISDWYFRDEDDAHNFVFPKGTTIHEDGYLVICRDKTIFSSKYPSVTNFLGNFEFGFNAAGEKLRLYNQEGVIIDSLTYDDKLPWPEEPDGTGVTLELINPTLDNSKPESWKASLVQHGTPGEQNSVFTGIEDEITINTSLLKVSPNPIDDNADIEFNLQQAGRVSLGIYDMNGRLVSSIIDNKFYDSGNHNVNIITSNLSQQVYYCKLEVFYPNQMVVCVPVVRIK